MLQMQLKKAGYDRVSKQVETAEELTATLSQQDWDVILSDYRLRMPR